jgi:gliding motility-associated-like protein
MVLSLSVFLQVQSQVYNKPHSCMSEAPSLYNWQDIEAKLTKRLQITPADCKNFFRYAAKLKYLKIEEYQTLVKEGAITKANAQQYWVDKLPYFEDVYKFKYLLAIEKEKADAEKRNLELKSGLLNKTASTSCNNLDFSAGNLSNWTGKWNNGGSSNNMTDPTTGQIYGYGGLTVTGLNSSPTGYNSMGYVHEICTGGTDRNVPISTVPPGHSYSLRLGDDSAYIENINSTNKYPFNHQIISNTFAVTASSKTITYWYAVVLSQGIGAIHPPVDQPYFRIRMYDGTGAEITCANYDVNVATAANVGGFDSLAAPGNTNEFYYRNWTPVFIPLDNYMGQNITITFESSDCDKGGHFGYAYLAVDCAPEAVVVNQTQPCVGGDATLTAPAGLATYTWTGPGIVGSNTVQVASANVGGTYTVSMTTFANAGQTGCVLTLSASVASSTLSPVASFSATTPCLNNSTQFTDESTLAANQGTLDAWNWTFGDGATSTSSNPTHTYATAGSFPVSYSITSSEGCTATYSTMVTVNPIPTASFIADTVCKQLVTTFTNTSTGGTSYNWNFGDGAGTSVVKNPTYIYTNSGTFVATLTVTNSFNCPVTTTNSVEVTANAIVAYSTPTVCVGSNSVFNNTSTPTTNVAYNWNFGDATNPADTSNLQNPTYLYPTAGTYTVDLTITSTSGCVSSKIITVNVNPIPQVAVTSPPPYCWNDVVPPPTYTPSPNANVAYSWVNNNPSIGLAQTNGVGVTPQFTAAVNNTGTNILGVITVTPSLNGCTGSPESYTVVVKPTPSVTHGNLEYCPNAVVSADTITAVPANATITWNTINTPFIGLSTTNGSTLIPSFTSVGSASGQQSNLIVVTDTLNGCAGPPITFSITVDPNPVAKFYYVGACDGNNTQFVDESTSAGSPISQWNWNFGTGTSTIKDPSFLLTPANTTFAVSLTVTTLAGCKNNVTESVFVNPSAKVDFFADSVSCTPLKTIFTDVVSIPVKTWTWDFGNSSTATYTTQTIAQQTYTNGSHTQTNYYSVSLTVVTDSNCVTTITKPNYITVYPKPLAGFAWGPKDADIIDPLVYFQNQSIGASGPHAYNWNFGDYYETVDSLNYSTIANPQHAYSEQAPGDYVVTQIVQNIYGCADTIREIVIINDAVTFYIPNAFSPNGDGTNEGFKGEGIGIKDNTYNMWIFDRWGLMIFHATNLETSWDGRKNGDIVQEDVYVWKVSFYDDFNKSHDYHGTVTVVR